MLSKMVCQHVVKGSIGQTRALGWLTEPAGEAGQMTWHAEHVLVQGQLKSGRWLKAAMQIHSLLAHGTKP